MGLSWLNPGRWLLYLALLAALGVGIYRLDQSRQQIGYDKAQAEYTSAALKAEQVARAKENGLRLSNERISNELAKQKAARAADALATADRLRLYESTLDSIASADTGTTSGTDDAPITVARQCAASLVRMDQYAKELADQTRGLQEYASRVCVSR